MKRDRIVCECLKVSERRIVECVRDGRACSIRQIGACTGAGTGCTACHPALEAILGFRPEDATIVDPAQGDLRAAVFSCELTGNETIVTCSIGETQAIVKMDKDFDIAVDAQVGIKINGRKACLFDPDSGDRIRAGA